MFKKDYEKILKKVNKIKFDLEGLSDEELSGKTLEFKNRIEKGDSLDSLLPEAFAVVCEADKRILDMYPHDVQIMGGIVLHQGRVAELKTGEGKSLVATMPAYLNALKGEGVHVVSVNDYLVKRDYEELKPMYEFLGLSVGCVISGMTQSERRLAYDCDITYVTNSELGFDYLRDNTAKSINDVVQRSLNYVIIDEVDSILIDEAKTPLIISRSGKEDPLMYNLANLLIKDFEEGEYKEFSKIDALYDMEEDEDGDYTIDWKSKRAHFTERGYKKIEDYFHIDNISDPKNIRLRHIVNNALQANTVMMKNKDYIVDDKQVKLVDQFTGRVLDGRRYNSGLQQAIEAKEGVEIKDSGKVLATITYQSFFNKYKKKSGMTGTAYTQSYEFEDIYYMDVVQIPTNKPVIRKDHEDIFFENKQDKMRGLITIINEIYSKRQPILIGTTHIDDSEEISSILSRSGIPHTVLNAKNHALEADIISRAGRFGSVTIATNMAGRGTDIKLDDKAKDAGGLFVIGTQRHDSKRIDNQLIGRSGRQGDPGDSIFLLSFDDSLAKNYIGEKNIKVLSESFDFDGSGINSTTLDKAISRAQEKVSGDHYSARKNIIKYDAINDQQREKVYSFRRDLLFSDDVSSIVYGLINDFSNRIFDKYNDNKKSVKEDVINEINSIISDKDVRELELPSNKRKAIVKELKEYIAGLIFNLKSVTNYDSFFRQNLLNTLDKYWLIHLERIEELNDWINLLSLGEQNPEIGYKEKVYEIFEEEIYEMEKEFLSSVLKYTV